jgi:CubicO group peptidase (beta-lactamase class C family)
MDTGALRDWLDGRVVAHEFSGAALVRRGDESLFGYAGGLADRGLGVPVAESTRFAVASVTKMVTATTALRLVERGALRLDQPVLEVLPPEHRTAALTSAHTLHHLLSHTSGLPNYHDDEDRTWNSFVSCWDRVPCQRARGPADLLPLFRDLPAHAPPGERYSYADANFILVGLLIEAVTGRPYGAAATEEVLRPAGMADSGFDQRDADPPRLATGYLHEPDTPFASWRFNVFSVPSGGMPDGGLITTTADLARLMDALVGGRLLAADTFAATGRRHHHRRAVQPGPRLLAGVPAPHRRARAHRPPGLSPRGCRNRPGDGPDRLVLVDPGAACEAGPASGGPTLSVPDPPGPARVRPNDVDLPSLLLDLLAARAAVAQDTTQARNRRPTPERAKLLACMEAYSAALTARQLPIPPRLRDDLRLHRALYPPDPRPGT